jgi:hypothetical protein
MAKQLGNEDWDKRKQGLIPTKGAQAAERASAGLGTSDSEELSTPTTPAPVYAWPKARRSK